MLSPTEPAPDALPALTPPEPALLIGAPPEPERPPELPPLVPAMPSPPALSIIDAPPGPAPALGEPCPPALSALPAPPPVVANVAPPLASDDVEALPQLNELMLRRPPRLTTRHWNAGFIR